MVRRMLFSIAFITAYSGILFAKTVTPPAGGANYFGASPDANFDPNAMLKTVPSGPPAAAPPALFGGAGSDPLLPAAPKSPWTGGAEFGFNGATGNSDLFNARFGINARRKTAQNLIDTDFLYTYTTTNGVTTQQQALFNGRDEILFAGTPWSVFGSTNMEYDELRNYRYRVGLYAGAGYVINESDRFNWRVRGGAGTVYEIGRNGAPDRFVPEAVFGTDFTMKLDDRQSFVTIVDFYPRINDWSQFRVRARAAYQILIDPSNNIMLRLGVQERYDSNPGSAKPNDLNYFASLGISF